jgi:glycosyltransferase involved in cell wall biosynthesis
VQIWVDVRIALIPSAYAPAVGGVELLTADLARHLVEAGDIVEVWTTLHPPDLADDETIDGLRVRRFAFPMPRAAAGALIALPRNGLAAWLRLRRAAQEFRPDVLHVQCFSANGSYTHLLASRTGLPLVVSLQGETVIDDADLYEHSVTQRFLLKRALQHAAAVTGCSAFVLDDARQRFGLATHRGRVVPNGVNLDGAIAPDRIEMPVGRFVLGLGRLVDKKGFDLLVDAFARIAARDPHLRLVIAGDGPARDGLCRRIAGHALSDRVTLPGSVSRAQARWLMEAAAAFVLPSRIEPFGIVVVEALRAGCPTIVSCHGGATEIVRDGIEGLVADPADGADLAEKIEKLLADAELARKLTAAGRARAARYDWVDITHSYRDLYAQVLASQALGSQDLG